MSYNFVWSALARNMAEIRDVSLSSIFRQRFVWQFSIRAHDIYCGTDVRVVDLDAAVTLGLGAG